MMMMMMPPLTWWTSRTRSPGSTWRSARWRRPGWRSRSGWCRRMSRAVFESCWRLPTLSHHINMHASNYQHGIVPPRSTTFWDTIEVYNYSNGKARCSNRILLEYILFSQEPGASVLCSEGSVAPAARTATAGQQRVRWWPGWPAAGHWAIVLGSAQSVQYRNRGAAAVVYYTWNKFERQLFEDFHIFYLWYCCLL